MLYSSRFFMTFPRIIAWNCRGAGSRIALRHLILLVRTQNPDILILEETRVSSRYIDQITAQTRFTASIVSEAYGFSGGIWILWDKDQVDLDLIELDEQIISVVVCSPHQRPWLLSAIYASPNPLFRQDLWDYLRDMGYVVNIPWLLLGDFNQVLHHCEKRGGSPVSNPRLRAF